MGTAKSGDDLKFGILWALANLLGWAVAGWLSIALTGLTGGANGELLIIPCGLAIGFAQWLVLAKRFSRSGWLILAYGLGWYVGLWIGYSTGFLTPEPITLGAAGGIIVGVMQWLVMKRRARRAWVWIPALAASSTFGCWLGVHAGIRVNEATSLGTAMVYAVGGAVAGAVIGLLSGAVLIVLTRPDRQVTGG